MHSAGTELQRVADQFKTNRFERSSATLDDAASFGLWNELTKPLGSILRMDQARLAMTPDPMGKLEELFHFYVERNQENSTLALK
jgi:hypothetical protein